MDSLLADPRVVWSAALIVVAAAVVAVVFVVLRRRRSPAWRLQHVLRSIAVDSLANIVVPDGMGGEIHIDYLLLTRDRVLVLEVQDVTGAVFAGANMDQWAALVNGKRFAFGNPLLRLRNRATALTTLEPSLALDLRVLFIDDVSFPKGHPDEVCTFDTLQAEYPDLHKERLQPDAMLFGPQWQRLKEAVIPV